LNNSDICVAHFNEDALTSQYRGLSVLAGIDCQDTDYSVITIRLLKIDWQLRLP